MWPLGYRAHLREPTLALKVQNRCSQWCHKMDLSSTIYLKSLSSSTDFIWKAFSYSRRFYCENFRSWHKIIHTHTNSYKSPYQPTTQQTILLISKFTNKYWHIQSLFCQFSIEHFNCKKERTSFWVPFRVVMVSFWFCRKHLNRDMSSA